MVTPTNCAISFTHHKERLFGPLDDLIITNSMGTHTIPRVTHYYISFTRLGTNATVARSMAPLENGFQFGFLFSAAGVFMATNWTLSPVGQLHYDIPTATRASKETGSEPLEQIRGYNELQLLLTLGIEVQAGSVAWVGNHFKGDFKIDPNLRPADRHKWPVVGELTLSNGMPAHVSYHIGKSARREVTYFYSRKFELPFPSEINVDGFDLTREGREIPVSTEKFEITDARMILTDDDAAKLAPKYFAETSGQPVREFLASNGQTIAAMRNGAWLFDKSRPKPRNPAATAWCILVLVIALIPVMLFVWNRMRGNQDSRG